MPISEASGYSTGASGMTMGSSSGVAITDADLGRLCGPAGGDECRRFILLPEDDVNQVVAKGVENF